MSPISIVALCFVFSAFLGVSTGQNNEPPPGLGFLLSLAPRIAGGTTAKENRYPWMVSIQSRITRRHLCGGILIRDDVVLTAAHCVDSRFFNDADRLPALAIGGLLRVKDDTAEVRKACKTIIHSEFNGNVVEGQDIALIILDKKSTKEPFKELDVGGTREGQFVSVLGWGRQQRSGTLSDRLLEGKKLRILTNEQCNNPNAYNGLVKDQNVCADGGRRDTCQGDSGGPLFIPKEVSGTEDILVGVTSFGPEDCGTGIPGVYVRVSEFLGWINGLGAGQAFTTEIPGCIAKEDKGQKQVEDKSDKENEGDERNEKEMEKTDVKEAGKDKDKDKDKGKEQGKETPADDDSRTPTKEESGSPSKEDSKTKAKEESGSPAKEDGRSPPMTPNDMVDTKRKKDESSVDSESKKTEDKKMDVPEEMMKEMQPMEGKKEKERPQVDDSDPLSSFKASLPTGACNVVRGVNLYGDDINDGTRLITQTPEECCSKCQEVRRCVAWTWVGQKKQCWLKWRIPKKMFDVKEDAAGTVKRERKSRCQGEKGMSRWGLDFIDGEKNKVKSVDECCQLCDQHPSCKSWNYQEGGLCWLKNGFTTDIRKIPIDTSGTKQIDCVLEEGVNYYGEDINDGRRTITRSPLECCQLCIGFTGCASWSRLDNGQCWLKWRISSDRRTGQTSVSGVL